MRGSPGADVHQRRPTAAQLPDGPAGGVAFNLTLLSYLGSLDMGLNVDAAAVEHPERLAALVETSFKDLQHA